jgi:hypothetical protein
MPIQRLIGNEWSSVPTASRLPNYYGANKYTVLYTGVVKYIRNYSISSGNLKVAAHLDNGSDHPGDLLASNDDGYACAGSSWNEVPIDDFAVTQNDEVWLGGNCDTNGTLSSSAGGTLRYVAATYSTWAASDPSINLPSTYGHTVGMQAWGYIPPSISGVNSGNPITPGGSLSGTGSDFETAQGAGKFELCDNINYDSATIKVEQTVSTWVDDTITGTVVQGGLSAGTVYAFVTTDSGQRNSVGFAVTLSASTNACTGNIQSPASISASTGTQSNQASVSVFSPASEAAASTTSVNSASGEAYSPASEHSAGATQANEASADFLSPASKVAATASSANIASGNAYSPAPEYSANATQANDASASFFSPASEASATATNAAVNIASANISSPASQASASATQQNIATADFSSPASVAHAVAINAILNYASAVIYSPASMMNATATQENKASAAIWSPASAMSATEYPFTREWIIPLVTDMDGFEIVRDRIAEILALETASQQALAAAAGYDPDDWKFLVYAERIDPWELYRDGADKTPIVNVWYDSDVFDKSTSNNTTRQTTTSQFNIDCYAWAPSRQTVDGHAPGDESAAMLAHKIGRFVRKFLMHPKYRRLGFTNAGDPVWDRWVANRTAFQPQSGNPAVQNVMGLRVALEVRHNETVELEEPETLELINIKLYHEPDGLVRAELRYEV